jgi:NAD(P)-dependent dehydrogenase (short-subunit alcohol dehydrogenase family)
VSRWAPIVGTGSVLDALEDMLTLNAVVPLRMAAAVAQQYWCRAHDNTEIGNPSIVNISSTAGVYLYEGLGQSGYAASKAALNMLTCHLADEFAAFGVRANALAPNSFPSHVSTESVAAAVVRLDKSDLTGRVLVVDSDGETLL